MKKQLAAIEAAPSPERFAELLELQTKNLANRKGFAAEWSRAALACARLDASQLWDVIAKDWETYRVWHAIQVLGALGDKKTIARLIELGRTRIIRIHWDAIERVAAAASVPIPAGVAKAQAELEKERGPSDFHAEFAARRPPAELAVKAAPAEKKAKAAPKKPAVEGVPAALRAPESNTFVAAQMASLAKSFKLTRRASLSDAVEIAGI